MNFLEHSLSRDKISSGNRSRGLKGYRVIPLSADDPDLPPNIYITNNPDPAAACREMYWAIHTAPYNIAIWTHPVNDTDPEIKNALNAAWDYKHHWSNFWRKNFCNFNYTGKGSGEYIEQSLRKSFNRISSRSGNKENKLLKTWLETSHNTIQGFANAFGPSKMDLYIYGENYGLFSGDPELNTHIDFYNKNYPFQKYSGNKSHFEYTENARLLWAQKGESLLIADNRDLEIAKDDMESRFSHWIYSFKKSEIILRQPPLWSVAMIPRNGWPHFPVVHSSPIENELKPLRRFLWDISLLIPPELIEAAYDAEYDDFLKKISGHKEFSLA